MLKIYNSLTNQKETFVPINKKQIRMYVCGVTVYDYCHIGHARVMIVFDIVYRYLQSIGYEITYVRNITDIDDKIIARAANNNEPYIDLVNRFIDAMHEDEAALGVHPPTHEPKATENMPEIQKMISKLIEKKYAYQGKSGDIYYDVSKYSDYGKLSGRNLDDLHSGKRISIDNNKDDPLDFVLWKMAKPDEPYWKSPWGNGRPGWHIECSTMSTTLLGNNFDIHGGGHDLQFPHHENEIAQSEACTGETYANYWMHNGFIKVDNEKMSKSLDNFFTIREILKEYHAEVIRYFMLTSQYRSPLNYSSQQLDSAHNSITRLYTSIRGLPKVDAIKSSKHIEQFHIAMKDDFNTPKVLSIFFDLSKNINQLKEHGSTHKAASFAALLISFGKVLGILKEDPDKWFQRKIKNNCKLAPTEIDNLIKEREQARSLGKWEKADEIRNFLKKQKILIEDGTNKTTWKKI